MSSAFSDLTPDDDGKYGADERDDSSKYKKCVHKGCHKTMRPGLMLSFLSRSVRR